MNERIKELATQAGWKYILGTHTPIETRDYIVSQDQAEKFAELIVRKCVSIITEKKDMAIDNEWNVDETCSMIEFDIIDNFGLQHE